MSWGVDYGRQVSNKKSELGKVPDDTCPEINTAIDILEDLRRDNSRLRELGHEWYKFAEELAEESQKNYEELEKEKDELLEEIKTLKEDIKYYENELSKS